MVPSSSGELVSVIIPAWNAAATLDATLRSVRAQTHRALEVIVVNDGSTDATADIVVAHASQDSRIRLESIANSGVAAARNRGMALASGELFAFLDADDLWAPEKLRKQLEALRAAGSRAGLAYTWSTLIDSQDRIIPMADQPQADGDVLELLCRHNFLCNASVPLVTRAAAMAVPGGFDTSLRARGAQGAEDWKFYLQLAERYDFVLVPEALTGYRQSPGGMSTNLRPMFRSGAFVISELAKRRPDLAPALREGFAVYTEWLLSLAIGARHFPIAAILSLHLARHDPARLARCLLKRNWKCLLGRRFSRKQEGAPEGAARFAWDDLSPLAG